MQPEARKLSNMLKLVSLLILLVKLCEAEKIFNDQLHVISSVNTISKDGKLQLWYMDEHLDRENSIASMDVFDAIENKRYIYYNDFSQKKLVVYDKQIKSCQAFKMEDTPVSILRNVFINAMPYNQLSDKDTEISLGPSIMLVAIEKMLSQFTYISSKFDNQVLAQVDYYELAYSCNDEFSTLGRLFKKMVLTLRVLNSQPVDKKNTTKKMTLDIEDKTKLEFLSMQICKPTISFYRKRQFGAPIECPQGDFIAAIDFHYIDQLNGGTLIGQDLDKTSDYDYQAEPFMQPVGLGCWDVNEGCLGKKVLEPPSLQFSAQYITSNGTKELGYVAYDGYRKVLRIDRNKRKSIYDLTTQLSYNMISFMGIEEKTDMLERDKSCVVLKSPKQLKSKDLMESVLGLSRDKIACHLGTKLVDHVHYEVFEREILVSYIGDGQLGYKLPILLEAIQFTAPFIDLEHPPNKRYFLTFYTQEYPNSPDVNGFERFNPDSAGRDYILLPKYIEFWEMSRKNETVDRKLINRLMFTEFNWSLDVEPCNDPDTNNDLSQIFNVESCSFERDSKLSVKFRITPYEKNLEEAKAMNIVFNRNPHMIKEIIHEQLSSDLDIPRLAMVELNLFKQHDYSLLFAARIADLHTGITKVESLGYVKYLGTIDLLKGSSLLKLEQNRHNLEECRLDSLMESRKNTLMFCEGLTVCALFKQGDVSKITEDLKVKTSKFSRSNQIEEAECLLEQFAWAQIVKSDDSSVVKRIKSNEHLLFGRDIRFNFRYKPLDNESAPSQLITYKGFSQAIDVKLLDPEASLSSNSALVGLRYTTMKENFNYVNMNENFRLDYFQADKFKYCNLACQFDDYCGSFSFCSRRNKNLVQPYDCILSTLWLTADNINNIDQLIRGNKSDLTMCVTSYSDSQEFLFKPDSDCSIHPRDFLSSYSMTGLLRVNRKEASSGATSKDKDNKPLENVGFQTTLESCAAQDYESSLWSNLATSNFTYCPMGSMCIILEKDIDNLVNNQVCYEYRRSHSEFYSYARNSRLSIQLAGNTIETNQSRPFKKKDLSESLREELETAYSTKLVRSFEGLTNEECARDCNMLKSKCLAYDFCLFPTISVCNLYSVRSSLARYPDKRLGYLPIERQFFDPELKSEKNASLIRVYGSQECTHFYLKDAYFNIRLQQLLDSSSATSSPNKQREKFDSLEKDLLDDDARRSKEALEGALKEQQQIADRNTGSRGSKSSSFGAEILLLLGAVIGALGLAYGGQAIVFATDKIQSWRARRSERYMNHRISRLALTNNHEI